MSLKTVFVRQKNIIKRRNALFIVKERFVMCFPHYFDTMHHFQLSLGFR